MNLRTLFIGLSVVFLSSSLEAQLLVALSPIQTASAETESADDPQKLHGTVVVVNQKSDTISLNSCLCHSP